MGSSFLINKQKTRGQRALEGCFVVLLRCIDADVPNRCFKGTAWFKSAGSERDAALRAGVTAALDAGFRHIDEAEMYVLITVRSSYVLITVSRRL